MENIKRKRKTVTYTLPNDVADRLKEHSDKTHISMSVIVQLALEDYLRKEELKVQGE